MQEWAVEDWIGWLSSFILLVTLAKQLYKQWQEKTSKGVSKWLYIGQFAAEFGFISYSWMVGNWVFFVTNIVLLLENIIGLLMVLHYRKRERLGAGVR